MAGTLEAMFGALIKQRLYPLITGNPIVRGRKRRRGASEASGDGDGAAAAAAAPASQAAAFLLQAPAAAAPFTAPLPLPPPSAVPATNQPWPVGERISKQFLGDGSDKWYDGTVTEGPSAEGYFTIYFDDGDCEEVLESPLHTLMENHRIRMDMEEEE